MGEPLVLSLQFDYFHFELTRVLSIYFWTRVLRVIFGLFRMRPPKRLSDFLPATPSDVCVNPCVSHIQTIPINEGDKHIPKYAGYVPTIKFDQGRTFPDHTEKYMKLHRSKEIGHIPPEVTSWYIPQTIDHKFDCVKGKLHCMGKEAHVDHYSHRMFNVEKIRERNTNELYNAAQTHRHIYKHCHNPGEKVKYLHTEPKGPSMFVDN